ncbi:MAG: GAF domain-containing protein [Gaiellaceae bacterium]
MLQYEPWLVTDAEIDPRTLTNPLVVGELGLRFYAGAPLTTGDGYNLGTLNIIDTEPREIDAPQVATLKDLAAIVVDELELRLAARREEESLERLKSEFVATASHQLRKPLWVGMVDKPFFPARARLSRNSTRRRSRASYSSAVVAADRHRRRHRRHQVPVLRPADRGAVGRDRLLLTKHGLGERRDQWVSESA